MKVDQGMLQEPLHFLHFVVDSSQFLWYKAVHKTGKPTDAMLEEFCNFLHFVPDWICAFLPCEKNFNQNAT